MPSPSVKLDKSNIYNIDSPKVDSEGESLPVSDSIDLPDGEPTLWRLSNASDNIPG